MNKQIYFLACAILFIFTSINANAQQSKTVEERVKAVHEKFINEISPDSSKLAKIDGIFTDYYRTADEETKDILDMKLEKGQGILIRRKMKELAEGRDVRLSNALTAEEFKIWNERIAPHVN